MEPDLSRNIRIARVTGDSALLSEVLSHPDVEQQLQAAGEALLAVRARAGGHDDTCQQMATRLAALLEARDWTGDRELAALLRDDPAPDSPRRRVRADLDEVADLLEGSLDSGLGGVLDLQIGSVWPETVLDDWPLDDPPPDPDRDPQRYLYIPTEGSRDAWRDMRDFAAGLADTRLQQQLLEAINGKGAFSRFKRILDRYDDLWPAWMVYSSEARCGRARAYLHDRGYDALPAQQ